MIDKPLYENPLGGGSGLDMGKYIENPNFQGAVEQSNAGMKIDPIAMKYVLKDLPKIDEAFNPANPPIAPNVDPIMQGFQNSDFYKNANQLQQDAVNFKYKGEDKMMNSSMAGALKQYLNSIGQGDLYESDNFLGGELATVNPITSGNDFMESPDNNAMIPGDPGLYAPPTIKTPGLPPPSTFVEGEISPIQTTVPGDSPFQTTGQYLTGPNESNNVLETLKNIEQGIASLGGNFGQNFDMNQSSNYGNFNNFGIGSFFPPYGGMYG